MKTYYLIFNPQDVPAAEFSLKEDTKIPGYWLTYEIYKIEVDKENKEQMFSHLTWVLNGLRYIITKERKHI